MHARPPLSVSASESRRLLQVGDRFSRQSGRVANISVGVAYLLRERVTSSRASSGRSSRHAARRCTRGKKELIRVRICDRTTRTATGTATTRVRTKHEGRAKRSNGSERAFPSKRLSDTAPNCHHGSGDRGPRAMLPTSEALSLPLESGRPTARHTRD